VTALLELEYEFDFLFIRAREASQSRLAPLDAMVRHGPTVNPDLADLTLLGRNDP